MHRYSRTYSKHPKTHHAPARKRSAHSTRIPFTTKSIRFPRSEYLKMLWYRHRTTLIRLVLVCCFAGLIGIFGGYLWLSKDLPTTGEVAAQKTTSTTKILDRSNTISLFDVYRDEKRTPVSLDAIPEYVRWATISAEDRTFYLHGGVSIRGMIRALVVNVLRGRRAQGGSTITQQYIKNSVLSPEKKFARKFKEIILAYKIEKKFTKDQILELYLNEIPYGGTVYGIEAASQTFFNKKASELTLAQAAVLAAIPQAPTFYSPYGLHKDALIARQNHILNQMEADGYISKKQHEEAKMESISFSPTKDRILAPHFVMYIRGLVADMLGEQALAQGGLTITTSLNMKAQAAAESAVQEYAKKNEDTAGAKNAALVAMDPKTGEILAMVGSRDYFDTANDGNVNVALRPRQPGSSFKPIVYLGAFQQGYSPDTVLFDVETGFKTNIEGIYTPKNYNEKTYGPVSLRKALAGSLNIPAVKLIYLVGIHTVLDLAETMGYTTLSDRSRFGLSLVLGGGEVTLLEHVRAYSILAREGYLPPLTPILKITNRGGEVLYEQKAKPKRVLPDPEPIRNITDILTDREARSFVFGEGASLTLGNRPVAVKTGTTNDFRDAWTIGYTPSLVAGVWVGNNDNSPMKRGLSTMVAAPIWHSFMEAATKDDPIETFKKPEKKPLPNKPMLNGSYESTLVVRIDTLTNTLANESTPPQFVREQKIPVVHSILHYVNRLNPLGPVPDDPTKDEQYALWEAAVQIWAGENGYGKTVVSLPPSEPSDQAPKLSIHSPLPGTSVITGELPIHITTTPGIGAAVDRVEYFFDGAYIKTFSGTFSETTIPIPNTLFGVQHTLTLVVYDTKNRYTAQSIPLLFPNAKQSPYTWVKPLGGTAIAEGDFPTPIIITVSPDIKKVDYYIKNSSQTTWIGFTETFKDSRAQYVWSDPPEGGVYTLSAVLTTNTNEVVQSDPLSITIF